MPQKPSIFRRWIAQRPRWLGGAGEIKTEAIGHPAQLEAMLRRGEMTDAGVPVNDESAMRVSAVNACVRIISETIASLPLKTYRRLPGGGKAEAPDHPVARLLRKPNAWQTPMEFREMQMAALLLRGNAYALKNRLRGEIQELLPVHPDRVHVEQTRTMALNYSVQLRDNTPRDFRQQDVTHIRGLAFDGVTGRAPIADARQAIGLGSAQERFGSRLYGRGAHFSAVLRHPQILSPQARENMEKSWNETYGGSAGGMLILEEGVEFDKLSMTAEDAQFLDARRFQISDIARFFRIQLHLLQELSRSTNNNIEEQAREFLTHTLRPWLVRIEQAYQRDLFDDSEEFFCEHNADAILRGDLRSRFAAYAVAIQNGWMNVDEVREKENQNPLPDGAGEVYLRPTNAVPAGQEPEEPTTVRPAPPEDDEEAQEQ